MTSKPESKDFQIKKQGKIFESGIFFKMKFRMSEIVGNWHCIVAFFPIELIGTNFYCPT